MSYLEYELSGKTGHTRSATDEIADFIHDLRNKEIINIYKYKIRLLDAFIKDCKSEIKKNSYDINYVEGKKAMCEFLKEDLEQDLRIFKECHDEKNNSD